MALLLRFSLYIRTCESLSQQNEQSWSKWQSSTVMCCSASWWACGQPSLSPSLMSWLPNLFSYAPFGLFLIFWEKICVFALAVRRSASKIPLRKVPPLVHYKVAHPWWGSSSVMAAMTLPLEYTLPPSVYVIQRASSITVVNLPVIISCFCCCHRKSTTRKLGERKHTHMLTFWGSFLSFGWSHTRSLNSDFCSYVCLSVCWK